MALWTLHGDGKNVTRGGAVAPGERLTWPRTIGLGMQHVVAMFGATFLVPLITGFPPATTLFFSAMGTFLFLLITRNRLPSYLGSSFAFLAPIAAAGTMSDALGGIVFAGTALFLIGVAVHLAGVRWIEALMPPVVTGAIVALIGLNLAGTAWGTCDLSAVDGEVVESCTNGFRSAPLTAGITVAAIAVSAVIFRGLLGRLSILLGVIVGYVAAVLQDQVTFAAVREAAWVGLPHFTTPTFNVGLLGVFLPVVFVLVAENVGHVKSVAAMTGQDLDPQIGKALAADGLATVLAGSGGGSGTTTYAENIGVMAATRVYSTAVYWVAGATALVLSLSPKFGALIATIPAGVLGGAGTVLYGMIGLLGARIWVQNKVDFSDPVNLVPTAVALIAGIANFTFHVGSVPFEGIAVGSLSAIVLFQIMRAIARWRGTSFEPASPSSVPDTQVDSAPVR
ncbi:MAG: uracil-xanthine permease family protein [Cellulomonadaceae bacterium]